MGFRNVLLACLALTAPAAAQTPGEAPSRVDLLRGWSEPDGGRVAGLSIELDRGWKTYWRSPGEAGIPPEFDWTGSTNLAAVEVEWPAPELFDSFGFQTLGYDDEVTLPLRLSPIDPAQPIRLRLGLDYGVCAEICIPARADLALDIDPDAPPERAGAIAAALARAPMTGAEAGLLRAECALRGAGTDRRFDGRFDFDFGFRSRPTVVVEGPRGVWFGAAEARVEGRSLAATAPAQVFGDAVWVGRDELRVTVLDGARAIDIAGC